MDVHDDGEGWVVTRPDDVLRALTEPLLTTAPMPIADAPVGGAPWLHARMARFSAGEDHHQRRAACELVLTRVDPDALRRRAQDLAAEALAGGGDGDVMAVARDVPVTALATALGLPLGAARRASRLTGELCDALAPGLEPPVVDGDEAARQLLGLLAGMSDLDIAAVSLLFQTRDATAGLIGGALLADAPSSAAPHAVEGRVAHVLSTDPPVQSTRRRASVDLELAGRRIGAGEEVVVLLAAAVPGAVPGWDLAFGAGPHACPGRHLAVALATGVLCAVRALDRWGAGGPVRHEPRPNLRIPVGVALVPLGGT